LINKGFAGSGRLSGATYCDTWAVYY
jgi:hypothetical protein